LGITKDSWTPCQARGDKERKGMTDKVTGAARSGNGPYIRIEPGVTDMGYGRVGRSENE